MPAATKKAPSPEPTDAFRLQIADGVAVLRVAGKETILTPEGLLRLQREARDVSARVG